MSLVNTLKISVENADELLNTSAYGAGALIRVESASASGGTFAEIGTVAIVALTYLYTYFDQASASTRYYRTRYSNSANTNQSGYSAEFQAYETLTTYCTLYNAKQRLGIAATDTTDDENLFEFIDAASSWITGKTGRSFLPDPTSGTTTYLFDGNDAIEYGRCLLIPRGIRSITTLKVATNTGATLQTVPSTDYFIQPNDQERPSGWPGTELWMTDIPSSSNPLPYFLRGFNNISILGTFGWEATPSEIADVALNLTVASWRGRSSSGGDTFTIGADGERTFERMLSAKDWRTISRYTLRDIGII